MKKMVMCLKLIVVNAIIVLGVISIIGSSGDSGGGGNENGDFDNNNVGSLLGVWLCTTTFTDAYGGHHSSSSDIEYFADGTYESNPYEIPCTARGSWNLSGDQLTENITSVSGSDNSCNIENWDTTSYTVTITFISDDAFSSSRTNNGTVFNTSCNR